MIYKSKANDQALSITEKTDYQEYYQEYFLSHQAAAYLQKHHINIAQVNTFKGTAFQHQLYSEYCSIIEQAAAKQAQLFYESDLLTQCVVCAGTAYDANKLGYIKTVVGLNNMGFALLESVHAVITVGQQIAKNGAYMITHVEESFESLSKATLYTLETLILNSSLPFPYPARDQRNAKIAAGLQNLKNEFEQLTGLQQIKAVTQVAAEWLMAKPITSATGAIMGIPQGTATQAARFLKPAAYGLAPTQKAESAASRAAKNVAAAMQNMKAAAEQGVGSQRVGSDFANAPQKVQSAASKAAQNAARAIQNMRAAPKQGAGSQRLGTDVAKTVQEVETVAQEGNMSKAMAKELLDAEKQFDKSAQVVVKNQLGRKGDAPPAVDTRCLLEKNLEIIEGAVARAKKTEYLSDGRIRYYTKEVPLSTLGRTRGSSYVTEYDPIRGVVRSWLESYDHSGNVNRVHPKMINGKAIDCFHYPHTKKELEIIEMLKKGKQ